ncbi:MAG: phosphoribosylaminoimidazolesuccinocarboxamide synthase [Bacteroidia bacterium]|nr:phosphoribosylaminoimidazolesuccinocarboxamide synthase [Bacteroidia bacterium]
METEKTFRTKTGYCHILPDKVVLSRDGIPGNTAKVIVGNTIYRILFIYSMILCVLIYGMYDLYQKEHFFLVSLYGLISLFLLYGVISSLNNSTAPVIDRNKIRNILFRKGIPGLTRSRFEIKFEDEFGKIKKRLIMLPGSMSDGPDETKKALKIMTEEKLM